MPPKRRHRKVAGSTSSPQTPSLLNRVLEFYQQTFGACAEAAGFLREHGLSVPGLLEPFSPGYCDGSLLDTVPEDGPIRKTLKKLGILSANGRETFHGCLTLPMFDIHAGVVSLAGLNIQTAATTLLKLSPTHVWNIPACTRHTEVFFCEGIIDALSLAAAGFPNIAACVANTLTPGDIDVINAHGLRKITVFGPEAHKALAEPGPGIDVFHAAVPE